VGVRSLLGLILKAMGLIVHLVPLAVFASVAKVIGIYGLSFVGGLSAYLFFCLFGMVLHVVLVHQSWIVWVARMNLRRFWQEALEPVLYGFGVNSSLATLPVTLRAMKRLGISDSSARLSACVGTNFNNDGILLYEVVAVLFLAQAYGQELSMATQVLTALICVLAAAGVSGIPEAGVIALSLALSAANLPIENIPLLLTVDWIIARSRSAVNVLADITVALSIDALTHQKTE
jgi:DAACS family dicarboxylate/amino acid:cation (Na+ or H+) symporter